MLGTFRRHLRGERGAMSEFAHSRSPLNVIRISIDAGQAFYYRDLSILYPWTTVQPGLSKEARRPEIKLYVVGQSTYKSDHLHFYSSLTVVVLNQLHQINIDATYQANAAIVAPGRQKTSICR